jgi:uncharacterized protein YndB with AHSA1/START domain
MFGIAGKDQEEILNIAIDAKAGGAFSFVIRRQGKELDHFGTYLELKRPNRIAFTWAAREVTNPPQKVDSSRVNIDIVAQGTGCEVTLTHELAPEWAHFAEKASGSWKKMLNAIAVVLGENTSASPNGMVESIIAEYRRYKALGEGALAQLNENEMSQPGPNGSNSIAIVVWHLAGNLTSRFTDFLSSDGEKPWRQREEEFQARTVTRAELLKKWEGGWNVLFATLATLSFADLQRTITIRNQPMPVYEALHRSLAHTSYHVGQITYIAKAFRGESWKYLSIPPGQSKAYNEKPLLDRPENHANAVKRSAGEK